MGMATKGKAHEHAYYVEGARAYCKICGFAVPKSLVCCIGCGEPKVTTNRTFLRNQGPFCGPQCAHQHAR